MDDKKYVFIEDEPLVAAEPAVAMSGEAVSRSGLMGQNKPYMTDEFGRIMLSQKMKEAVKKAEQDYEDGKCLSEVQFKQRFAKWL